MADLIAPKSQNSPEQSQSPQQPRSSPPQSRQLSAAEAKKLLGEVKRKVDAVNNQYADLEDTINLAYFRGRQWISADRAKGQVFEATNPKKKTRYTANRLIKIVRTEHAKILKSRVIMNVIPATSDEADFDAARIGDKLADWVEYDKKLQQKDSRLVYWGLTTRIAFMHPYWNPSLGAPVDADGTKEGDVDFDVLSCFEVKYDPSATCWGDVRWVCKRKVRPVDYIRQVYGKTVKPESGITQGNIYDTKMSFNVAMAEPIKYQPLENVAVVNEYYELPTSEHPLGQRVTYAGDEILMALDDIGFGEEDKTERVLPFFPYVHIEIPGSVSGTNSVEQCRPMQKEYNRTRSQIIDSKDLMAYPKRVQERGAVDEEADNEIGGLIEYNQGSHPPAYMQPPQISSDAYNNANQTVEEMDFIAGQSQVANRSRDMSGYLFEMMVEQDDTTLAPSIENYINCKQAYMSYVLKMIHFRYIASRTLHIVGHDNVEMLAFKGSQLTSWDVRVQRGNLMQTNKVAKRAEVLNFVNLGLLDKVRDKDKIFRYLEFGMVDDLYNEAEQDKKQAKVEQINWENGEFPTDPAKAVRDFFNHAVHVEEHNRWRKSKRYEELDPGSQQIIDMHVQIHQTFLDAQMQKMLAQMAPPQSAGTPHNPEKLQEQVGNGEVIGDSMQGDEQPPIA